MVTDLDMRDVLQALGSAPDSETLWNIVSTLLSAILAGGAAIFSARWAAAAAMKNARELQDRDRTLDAQSCAALLSAHLHARFIALVHLLIAKDVSEELNELSWLVSNRHVIDASMPKLGGLGQQGAANLLAAYNGLSLLARDARDGCNEAQLRARTRNVARHIGQVLHTLSERYDLDRPKALEHANIDLGAVGLEDLKQLGL